VSLAVGQATAGAESVASRRSWRPAVRHSLLLFAATRLGLAVVALIATGVIPFNKRAGVPGWPAPPIHAGYSNLFTAWERWDALWFLRIAAHGYRVRDGSAAFFPLYPLAVRALSFCIGHHPLAAGLILSNGCFLAALILFFRLTEREYSRERARRATLYLAIFPTAFFFLAPYSESLFLLLVVACFLSARQRHWLAAGVAGALASATRSTGLVLVPALALEALLQLRASSPTGAADWLRRGVRPAIGTLLSGAGMMAYLLYWRLRSGDVLGPFSAQGGWRRQTSLPWATIYDGIRLAARFVATPNDGYLVLDAVVVVAVVAAAIWAAVRCRASYGAYVLFSLLLPLSLVFPGRPLMSVPRFALTIFPVFWGIAALDARMKNRELLVAASASLLGLLTMLFITWYYVF
jgi:hypothetical protein